MHLLLCALLATANGRPTVAIVPPVPTAGAEAWIGMAIADNLTTRLLIHSRFDPKTLQRIYPLNVFGWRQTMSAARADGIDALKAMNGEQIRRLQKQLGSDYTFVGSYKTVGTTVTVKWRLFGDSKRRHRILKADIADLATGTEVIANELLTATGQSTKGLSGHRLRTLPLAAMKPYGEALGILARQSLDPRARLVLKKEEITRAHTLLVAASEAAPQFVRAWVVRGIASAMIGEMERAETELVTAIGKAGEFEPANALGLYYLYDRQGKHDEAIKVLSDATTAHLGFLHGLGYLGNAYSRAGHGHEALQTFTTYHVRVPGNPWARAKRTNILSRIGKHDLAVEEATILVKEFPKSIMVRTTLASRLIDAQRFDEARRVIDRALKLSPNHPALLTRLSYIELEKNEPDKALALAKRAVEALGDGRGETLAGYAHLNLGHALGLLGFRNEAIEALKKAKELGVDAEHLLVFRRDPKLRELINDPRNPLR